MNVRITQIDGKLPNLALMAISAHHRHRGDSIYFTRDVERGLFESDMRRSMEVAYFASLRIDSTASSKRSRMQ